MTARPKGLLIGSLASSAVALIGLVALAGAFRANDVAEGLLLSGGAMFFMMKGAFSWMLYRRAPQPVSPAILYPREWHILSAGYFGNAVLFLTAALMGAQKVWSWAGVVGSSGMGWTYYVISRQAAGKDEVA